MHQYWAVDIRRESAVGITQAFRVFEFDSKAMRKLEVGQTLAVVIENGHASYGVQYYSQFSILFKGR